MVDWIKVVPETGGPGTSKLEISARPNTGRNERSTILKFVNNLDHVVKELHVTQMGSEEYVSFCGIREIVVEASASDIMVWGVTNSSRLTFSLAEGNLDIKLPEEYNAGGEIHKNGAPIKYDPGQHDEFVFRFLLHIPENVLKENRSIVIVAQAANANQACLRLTQTHKLDQEQETMSVPE